MAESPLVAVVDDDTSLRNATRDLLKAAGFSSATFEDAESFLASECRASAACLVADMRMPGMSGLDLHQALVASGDEIPSVLVTAWPEPSTLSRARAAGMACCLAKPFAPDDLIDCVRAALATRRSPIAKA
jgi:FixJ family two-component response regulator